MQSKTQRRRLVRQNADAPFVLHFSEITNADVGKVGGKNASLGELYNALRTEGVRIPAGFAITATGYWRFIDANGLRPTITSILALLKQKRISLPAAGKRIRGLLLKADFPPDLQDAIRRAYKKLSGTSAAGRIHVAVRSSATAEDLPSASFAGQHESFLNISGIDSVMLACRECIASLFNDRAISYRERNGFAHMKVALSVGVQHMVRSDKAGAGVMFTLDTETGFPDVVRIEGAWGLGELVVKGIVNPDAYMLFKPLLGQTNLLPVIERTCGTKATKMVLSPGHLKPTHVVPTSRTERETLVLNDGDLKTLGRWAVLIEQHYAQPMDIEWAKDGTTGKLYVVQARPETSRSRQSNHTMLTYRVRRPGKLLLRGLAVGEAAATGRVCKLHSPKDAANFPMGAILVAKATDPDWVPVMRRAAAIVTEQGGRTSHAAIVSREFNLPAVIGTGTALSRLANGAEITVSCAEGDEGRIYAGKAIIDAKEMNTTHLPRTKTQVMLNIADPAASLHWWKLPTDGIGLARMEFIISNHIKIHPLALARFSKVRDAAARRLIETMTRGYASKSGYFIDRLATGVARLAASQYPRPVIVRMSDFKTNEYAALVGGAQFEPKEENPMIGWRGASRYYSPDYMDGFALECQALAKARKMGFGNIIVMIPFCRTPHEADQVLKVMAHHGLKRHQNGLQVYVMCEIPSNVIQAEEFARRFDGFSIGSNDLTQLTLGVDRDSERLASLFREDNPAVVSLIRSVIKKGKKIGRKVGFCGQAPSNDPKYARLLVDAGIDSISVTPDSFVAVKRNVASAERRK